VVRSKHKVRSFAYCPARRKGVVVQLAVALTNNSFEVCCSSPSPRLWQFVVHVNDAQLGYPKLRQLLDSA
jgi:hypothetical protein